MPAFHKSLRSVKPAKHMLKCRIHTEKVSLQDFKAALAAGLVEPMEVHFPSSKREGPVADAFLIFPSKESQRKVHELNETAIGEWQLRLLPCSSWALEDARAAGDYQEVVLEPPEIQTPTLSADLDIADQVRSGYRSATKAIQVQGWIKVAREHGLKHEQQMGLKRLAQIEEVEKAEKASKKPIGDSKKGVPYQ